MLSPQNRRKKTHDIIDTAYCGTGLYVYSVVAPSDVIRPNNGKGVYYMTHTLRGTTI